jgi:hypothetical protein
MGLTIGPPPRPMRLSREVNPGPPALQANTLCKEPFDSVINRYSEHQIVLLQLYSFYAYENTLKVYYRSRRIRKKYFIVFGRIDIGVSEYAKSILACISNKLKEYKHIRRIRQEFFCHIWRIRRLIYNRVYMYLGEFWTKTPKLTGNYQMGTKIISHYCPFK